MMDYTVTTPQGMVVPVRNIYCVGRNYKAHVTELHNALPEEPVLFQKSLPALNTGGEIRLPEDRSIQHELEIVALIGHSVDAVKPGEEETLVIGLALGLDLTDRPFQTQLKEKRLPWLLAKSFPGSAVITEFLDPQSSQWNREFWLEKNGQVVQKGRREQMLFSIPELIRYVLRFIPLLKGDLLFTGTPEGVEPLTPGDQLRLGVGSRILANYTVW